MPVQLNRRVEVDLIDITNLIGEDESAEKLKNSLLPDTLRFCMNSEKILKNRQERKSKLKSDKELSKRIQSKILRFVKPQDKYLNFFSLLMKSREFYLAYQDLSPQGNQKAVIALPRTSKGKPFIPLQGGAPSDFEFSVSHQYPYICIARTCGYEIGIDIVTFDEINKNLYRNESEFLHVFRSSFADCEWNSIMKSSNRLNEFYLQWAVKEAYTKAIGMGLSLDFNSFATTFESIHGLWEYMKMKNLEHGIHIKGIVSRKHRKPQQFMFFFHLLGFNGKVKGCLCACTLAQPTDVDGAIMIDFTTKWLPLKEVLNPSFNS